MILEGQRVGKSKIVFKEGGFPGFEQLDVFAEVGGVVIGSISVDTAEESNRGGGLNDPTANWGRVCWTVTVNGVRAVVAAAGSCIEGARRELSEHSIKVSQVALR